MTEPQDPDHKAMWDALHSQNDAIASLRRTIDLNGYVPILKEIARRYARRREVWQFFRRPLAVASKLAWLLVGAIIWGVANHLFGIWPLGNP